MGMVGCPTCGVQRACLLQAPEEEEQSLQLCVSRPRTDSPLFGTEWSHMEVPDSSQTCKVLIKEEDRCLSDTSFPPPVLPNSTLNAVCLQAESHRCSGPAPFKTPQKHRPTHLPQPLRNGHLATVAPFYYFYDFFTTP